MKRQSVMAVASIAVPSMRRWRGLSPATLGRVRPSRPLAVTCLVLALLGCFLTAQGMVLEATGSTRSSGSFMPVMAALSLKASGFGGVVGLVLSLGFGCAGLWCWPRVRQEQVALQEQSLAAYDYVTGLPTVRLFTVLLDQACKQASQFGRSLGVLVVELSPFRLEPTGSAPLSATLLARVQAARIKSAMRSRDTVAHLGERQFAVLIDAVTSAKQIAECATHIQRTLSLPLLVAGQEVLLACRIGSAMLSPGLLSGEALLAEAVKSLGRANSEHPIHFFNASLQGGSEVSSPAVDHPVSLDTAQR